MPPFCPGPLSRRDLLHASSLSLLGLALGGSGAAARPAADGFGRAKACIFLFMWGGPSQLETWDPKPEAPVDMRGEFQPIATTVPGLRISEHFPKLARQAHRYAVVRSLTHTDPAHLSSVHHLLTGRHAPRFPSDADPPSRKDWPALGAMLARQRSGQGLLPPFVTLPWIVSHPAAPGGVAPGQNGGWMGHGFDPFVVTGDPNAPGFGIPGLKLPAGLSPDELALRRGLLGQLGREAEALRRGADAFDLAPMQAKALDLLSSKEVRDAFDLSREPERVRELYGRNIHGQCVLLARRLVEAGVSFVAVNWHQDGRNFWDTHGDNFNRLKRDLMPPADRAFAALLDDLAARGRLEDTLIVWVGEFGRNPQITKGNAGREHWPQCYSGVLAGGGVRGGQIYGRSDRKASLPAEDPVSPADLTATIYHALGVDPAQMVRDRDDRPIRLTEGEPLLRLFG